MSKPLDSRLVEFAYPISIAIYPNVKRQHADGEGNITETYSIVCNILLEPKDSEGRVLNSTGVTYSVSLDGFDHRLSVDEYVPEILAKFRQWVRQAKIEKSGFDIGEGE